MLKIVIHCLDKANMLEVRLAHYEAHKTYLAKASIQTVMSGPLLAKNGIDMIGSMFLIEADTIEDAIAFNKADPFAKIKLWETVEIREISIRVLNKELLA